MCEWIYISHKGAVKSVFAVGSRCFLALVAAGAILTLYFLSVMVTESYISGLL